MDTIPPKLSIKIKDFRAIKSADIILNGITIVSGINGSGKSTISKLLYHTIKTAVEFNKIIIENLFDNLREIRHFIDELSHELEFFLRNNNELKKKIIKEDFDMGLRFHRIFEINGDYDLKEKENKILSTIDLLIKLYTELLKEYKDEERFKIRFYRLERYFKEEFFEKEKNIEKIDVSKLLLKLKEQIKNKFQKANNEIKKRPINILNKIINRYFTENIDVKNYNIEELGALITNRNDKKLSNFLSINKIAYIDTPMFVGVDNIDMNNIQHWEDLDNLLRNKNENVDKKKIVANIFKNEIIDGETIYDNNNEIFIYKRSDGFTFDLLSCATGLKSFSILQILLNNGFLDNKTLLIIDEPEVHLHPEWIVQYARLIVLLQKELKVKFFIASHSPDMVMALKYIAKKELEDFESSVKFYFAKEKEKYRFNYENMDNNIEPIFNSFNTSLDKINKYGATEE